MKITKKRLKKIIQEELSSLYEESPLYEDDPGLDYDQWLDDLTAPTEEEDLARAAHEAGTQDLPRYDTGTTLMPHRKDPSKQSADETFNAVQLTKELADKLSLLLPGQRVNLLRKFLTHL